MLAALLVVAGWSAAEAAIFFIVADVPISWIAVRNGTPAAVLAAIVAACASAIGGAIVFWWASRDPGGVAATFAMLPGVDPALVADAADRHHKGPQAVLAGSFGGIPFKLFALEAARQRDHDLLLLAPLLRLPRFLLVAVASGAISSILSRWMARRHRLVLLTILWVAFYAWYWSAMAA